MAMSKQMIIRCIQLLGFIFMVIMSAESCHQGGGGSHSPYLNIFMSSAPAAYVIITLGLIIATAVGEPAGKKLEQYFNVVGFILFVMIAVIFIINVSETNFRTICYIVMLIVLDILFFLGILEYCKNSE